MKFIDNKGVEHERYLTMLKVDVTSRFQKMKNSIKKYFRDNKEKIIDSAVETAAAASAAILGEKLAEKLDEKLNDSSDENDHSQVESTMETLMETLSAAELSARAFGDSYVVNVPYDELITKVSGKPHEQNDEEHDGDGEMISNLLYNTLATVNLDGYIDTDVSKEYGKVEIDYDAGQVRLYDKQMNMVTQGPISETILQRVRHPEAYAVTDESDEQNATLDKDFSVVNEVMDKGANL